MKTLLTILPLLILGSFALAHEGHDHDIAPGKPAPNFTLSSATGEEVSLADFRGQYVVLEWINYGCPFVKKFYEKSGKMPELQQKWKGQDVVWLSICSSAPGKQGYMTAEEAQKINVEKNWSGSHYLIDSSGQVGREYNATATPQMVVINPAGEIVYMGAIDNKASVSPGDIPSSTNYVDFTLMAAMQGNSPALAQTRPYGCSVKY